MKDELDRLYDLMEKGFSGVHDRLDRLNDRTRTAEQKLAVLEDRGVRSRDHGARWGAGLIGAAGLLTEIIRRTWDGK